ncbi:Nn.00g089280.m01.CDS01 [Neocucurbitaria sp. VM-36]
MVWIGKKPARQHLPQPQCDPPPPPSPSGPDRCFLIQVEPATSRSSLPEVTFAIDTHREGVTVSTEWQESAKENEGTGFLDLPKEIRDMVYLEICGDLKREGFRWRQTAPPPPDREPRSQEQKLKDRTPFKDTEQKERPTVFADCAIMRTCRQVHAEFAEVMYSVPLQLDAARVGTNMINLPPMYASLVRSILVVRASSFECDSDKHWRELLQTANSLLKVFPNATALRVGWWHGPDWQHERYLDRNESSSRDVKTVEKSIRRVKRDASFPLVVPHQMEMVQLIGVKQGSLHWANDWIEIENIVHMSFAEAVGNLRSKPKKGKGTHSQKTYVW